jgi:hypothetical protein
MRAAEALANSSSVRAAAALANSSSVRAAVALANSPSIRAAQAMADALAVHAIHPRVDTASLRIARALAEFPAIETLKEAQNSFALRAVKALELNDSKNSFNGIAEQLKRNYGERVFSEVYELLIDEYPTTKNSNSLPAVSGNAKSKKKFVPFSSLSAEFYFNLFIALSLAYLSTVSGERSEERILVAGEKSEERILKAINDMEQNLIIQINAGHSAEDKHVFLITDRELNLRTGPSSVDYEVIDVIPKNLKVVELERSRDWVKVEVWDYAETTSKVGWAHGKYLLKEK